MAKKIRQLGERCFRHFLGKRLPVEEDAKVSIQDDAVVGQVVVVDKLSDHGLEGPSVAEQLPRGQVSPALAGAVFVRTRARERLYSPSAARQSSWPLRPP